MVKTTELTGSTRRLALLCLLATVGASPFSEGGLISATEEKYEAIAQMATAESKTIPCATERDEDLIVSLSLNSRIEKALPLETADVYRITLAKDQFLSIVVNQRGIDAVVSVCSPDGDLVADVDRPNGTQGPEVISLIAQTPGIYHLQISARSASGSNPRYELSIRELRLVRPDDEIRVDAERAVSEGNRLYDNGDLQGSIEHYKHAINLWRSLKESYEEAVALYGIGWSYNDLGSRGMVKLPPLYRIRWNYDSREEHKEAIDCFRQALTIMSQLKNLPGQAQAAAGIAWPYLYLEDYQSSLASFSQAFDLYRSLDNSSGQARALHGMAWAHALIGDDQTALREFSQALPLRKGDSLGAGATLSGMARTYSRLGKPVEALDCLERAFKLYESLNNRSGRHGRASTLSDKGWIYYMSNDASRAIDSFYKALSLRMELKDATGEANVRYGIARSLGQTEHLSDALNEMKKVLELTESLGTRGNTEELRTYYFSNVQEYYEFYIELAMRLHKLHPADGYAASALTTSERARSRELIRILGKNLGDVPRKSERELAEVQPMSATQIQSLLDPQTLLLEYFLGEDHSYLWVVRAQEQIAFYELPKRSDIEVMAAKIHDLMIERSRPKKGETTVQKQAREEIIDSKLHDVMTTLSDILLGRAAAILDKMRLVVIAPALLQSVPFSALPTPTKPASDRSAEPLLVDHEIVNLPSASLLGMLRRISERRSLPPKTLAVFADPVFSERDPRVGHTKRKGKLSSRGARINASLDRDDSLSSESAIAESMSEDTTNSQQVLSGRTSRLQRLLGTRWEAQQITSLVPEERRLLALDFEANRAKAMSGDLYEYRIVHFATHAVIYEENPSSARIVLSLVNQLGQPQDGYLTLRDVCQMKLRADLIVTSACETRSGTYVKGEGVIGLTRGFMYAGASRVIVSLWPTNDRVTAELMVKFYKKMLGPERMSPSAALRAAQIETWQVDRSRPAYFWAPFVFEGDWRPILLN